MSEGIQKKKRERGFFLLSLYTYIEKVKNGKANNKEEQVKRKVIKIRVLQKIKPNDKYEKAESEN